MSVSRASSTFSAFKHHRKAAAGAGTLRRCVAALLLAATAALCSAHAVVVESSPADGAALSAPPKTVELRFNVRVEQSLARATLRGPGTAPIALAAQNGGTGRSERVTLPLPVLKPGAYELRYHVLALDGHATQGLVRFRVLP